MFQIDSVSPVLPRFVQSYPESQAYLQYGPRVAFAGSLEAFLTPGNQSRDLAPVKRLLHSGRFSRSTNSLHSLEWPVRNPVRAAALPASPEQTRDLLRDPQVRKRKLSPSRKHSPSWGVKDMVKIVHITRLGRERSPAPRGPYK